MVGLSVLISNVVFLGYVGGMLFSVLILSEGDGVEGLFVLFFVVIVKE